MTILYTVGFTQKTASEFFSLIENNHVQKIIDIRLHPSSQLAGFTKKEDLKYFLKKICDCGYEHQPLLTPPKELFDNYQNKKITWNELETSFTKVLKERKAETAASENELKNACLLCSEKSAEKCHRRLVAEYLQKCYPKLKIVNLE